MKAGVKPEMFHRDAAPVHVGDVAKYMGFLDRDIVLLGQDVSFTALVVCAVLFLGSGW
jgi:hypothetical protein